MKGFAAPRVVAAPSLERKTAQRAPLRFMRAPVAWQAPSPRKTALRAPLPRWRQARRENLRPRSHDSQRTRAPSFLAPLPPAAKERPIWREAPLAARRLQVRCALIPLFARQCQKV